MTKRQKKSICNIFIINHVPLMYPLNTLVLIFERGLYRIMFVSLQMFIL